MQFRTYRKVTRTEARVLTQEEALHRNGVIQTLEGPKEFRAGDYLARDAKGEWPIRREKIEQDYQRMTDPDVDGFEYYQPLDIREACQMQEDFTIGSLTGKAGDYLVKSRDSQWPVNREIFEQAYILIDTLNQ